LEALAVKYQHFKLQRLGNTHEKILVKDREFIAMTSFNWLSFRGDPKRTLRLERGICVRDAAIVQAEFELLVARFEPVARGGRRRFSSDPTSSLSDKLAT
jgi:hypothetical protein